MRQSVAVNINMDTKFKRVSAYARGIGLLLVVVIVSFASGAEFDRVKAWATNAFIISQGNSAQIEASEARIATLENELEKQNNELALLKQKQSAIEAKMEPKPTSKAKPPKAYPKPPADFVPLDKQSPKKKKKFLGIF